MFNKSNRGFTLIELMIVLAVIGILASIAYPSYINYVIRNDRLDGKEVLFQIQLAQERFKAQNGEYADDPAVDLNISGSQRGIYSVDIISVNSGGYVARAFAVEGSNQLARDADCSPLVLTVNLSGELRTPIDCW